MSSPKGIFTADLKATRDSAFTAVFVRMWIAGTMGAYFTFLFRNLALDLPTFSIPEADWPYTFVVWVRYAYLLWFLAYFFGSNVRYERSKTTLSAWDVGFDVLQAVIGIVAAYFLGFIVRAADGVFAISTSSAVAAANGAIALICLFSLICFGFRKYEIEHLKTLRIGEFLVGARLGDSGCRRRRGGQGVATRLGCGIWRRAILRAGVFYSKWMEARADGQRGGRRNNRKRRSAQA
jgi:hypothetical protein